MIVSLIVLLLSLPAFAGHELGNGGDSIVCEDTDGKTYAYLYDHFDGLETFGIGLYFGSSQTIDEKIEYTLNRLEKVDPYRSRRYRKWYQEFWGEAKMLYGRTLVDIPDTGAGSYPKNCKLVQTIVQNQPSFPKIHRYFVDMDTWNLLDDDSKVGFYLHEFILRDAIASGQTNSVATRYLNILLTSYNSLPTNLYRYVRLLDKLRFKYYDFGGIPLPIENMEFAVQYLLTGASVAGVQYPYLTHTVIAEELSLSTPVFDFDKALFKGSGRFMFDGTDTMGEIYFSEMLVRQESLALEMKVGTTPSGGKHSRLYRKKLGTGYFDIYLEPDSVIKLFDNGNLKELYAQYLDLKKDSDWVAYRNVKVSFNRDGGIDQITSFERP